MRPFEPASDGQSRIAAEAAGATAGLADRSYIGLAFQPDSDRTGTGPAADGVRPESLTY
jgi:hypothetical protein